LTNHAIVNIADAYSSAWFRNNNAGYGIYNEATGRHFYSESAAYWTAVSSNGMVFRSSHNGPATGYVYSDAGGSFGLLSPNGAWRVRVDDSNVETYGTLYTGAAYVPVMYDRDNGGYYVDLNNGSNLNVATANEWYSNGWFRVNGSGGVYWQQFGGGWTMIDATWLRTYGDKPILASGGVAGYGNAVFGNPFNTNPRMYANYDNAAGGGIMVSDDGGFFDFNDAWVQFRGSTGLQIRTNDPNWAILVNTGDVDGVGLYDKRISPSSNAYGVVGNSGNAWWQMWSYNFFTPSDERVKKDIEDLTEAEMRAMLDRLDRVRSVRFRYNEETSELDPSLPAKHREHPHVGVIAQSMPEEVVVNDGSVMGINLADTIGYTIVALRGLRAETREVTNDLYSQIQKRDKRIEALEQRVSEMEARRAGGK
jgi:hypothetical protein